MCDVYRDLFSHCKNCPTGMLEKVYIKYVYYSYRAFSWSKFTRDTLFSLSHKTDRKFCDFALHIPRKNFEGTIFFSTPCPTPIFLEMLWKPETFELLPVNVAQFACGKYKFFWKRHTKNFPVVAYPELYGQHRRVFSTWYHNSTQKFIENSRNVKFSSILSLKRGISLEG